MRHPTVEHDSNDFYTQRFIVVVVCTDVSRGSQAKTKLTPRMKRL
jgi:hypothetical protein